MATADLILHNGSIVTQNPAQPRAEALAAGDGRILAVGANRDVAALRGPHTRTIDLRGRLAVPGLIEGHMHLMGLGRACTQLRLQDARTWDDIVALVRHAVATAEPGAWLFGRGWHQDKWAEPPAPSTQGLPHHQRLSAAAPNNPVLLHSACGHAVLANGAAMAEAGIGRDTPAPAGGEIVRDAAGDPTGAFLENAMGLLGAAAERHRSELPEHVVEAECERHAALGIQACLAKGLTSVVEAGASLDMIERYRRMADEGRLPLRVWAMLSDTDTELAEALPAVRCVGDWLTVRAVKRFADGALGARTAWMLAPYDDRPDSVGQCVTEPAAIEDSARLALAQRLQICVHAIGDRAVRETLDVYERVLSSHPQGRALRWRIEHAQHVHPDDAPRFARLGVVAAMQASHCTTDGGVVPAALGPARARQTHGWRSLLDAGAVVGNGTDAPVEDVDPMTSFHAAVTRRLPDGTAFCPEQRMTREEALRSYTLSNAYAAFEDGVKGSLAPGKFADVTVLSRDILTIPEDEILGARALYTIVGGRVMYEE